jgi:hypothetical protein
LWDSATAPRAGPPISSNASGRSTMRSWKRAAPTLARNRVRALQVRSSFAVRKRLRSRSTTSLSSYPPGLARRSTEFGLSESAFALRSGVILGASEANVSGWHLQSSAEIRQEPGRAVTTQPRGVARVPSPHPS